MKAGSSITWEAGAGSSANFGNTVFENGTFNIQIAAGNTVNLGNTTIDAGTTLAVAKSANKNSSGTITATNLTIKGQGARYSSTDGMQLSMNGTLTFDMGGTTLDSGNPLFSASVGGSAGLIGTITGISVAGGENLLADAVGSLGTYTIAEGFDGTISGGNSVFSSSGSYYEITESGGNLVVRDYTPTNNEDIYVYLYTLPSGGTSSWTHGATYNQVPYGGRNVNTLQTVRFLKGLAVESGVAVFNACSNSSHTLTVHIQESASGAIKLNGPNLMAGTLRTTIENLDATQRNTTLTLVNTAAGDTQIGIMSLAGGKTVTIVGQAGVGDFTLTSGFNLGDGGGKFDFFRDVDVSTTGGITFSFSSAAGARPSSGAPLFSTTGTGILTNASAASFKWGAAAKKHILDAMSTDMDVKVIEGIGGTNFDTAFGEKTSGGGLIYSYKHKLDSSSKLYVIYVSGIVDGNTYDINGSNSSLTLPTPSQYGSYVYALNGAVNLSNGGELNLATSNTGVSLGISPTCPVTITGKDNKLTTSLSLPVAMDGGTITFIMDDAIATTDTMLTVSNSLNITDSTAVTVTGSTSLGLNETVTLATNVTVSGSFTDADYTLGTKTVTVTFDTDKLVATVTAITANPPGGQKPQPGGPGSNTNTNNGNQPKPEYYNINLALGAQNWARVIQQLGATHPLASSLVKAHDAANNPILSAWDRRVALGQFVGEYAMYANTPLENTTDRFRLRWRGENTAHVDFNLYADPADEMRVFSASALGSLGHGVRDRIACGRSRIWAGGFGAWADQDGKNRLSGYKYDSRGAAVGYEYAIGGLKVGIAAGYSRGDLEVKDLRYKNDADIANFALYGAYVHESGLYAEGGLGYGHAWNDYRVVSLATPGVKKGKYGSDSFTADLEIGYIARLPRGFNLVPSVGVEYNRLGNDSWTENVSAGLVANRFGSGHRTRVDIPLGLRLNRKFNLGGDCFIAPEIRAAFVHAAGDTRPSITAGFAGAGGGAKMVGVDPGRSRWRVGVGAAGRLGGRFDFRVEYDYETRSGFKGHNLNAAVGLSF